jgi:hypothetical protein
VWADAILSAEKLHLTRLMAWAALSVLAATVVFVLLAARRIRSPLLEHFALQAAGWGVAIAVIVFIEWRGLHLRDVSGMARLERTLWMNIGLDIGYVGLGVTLALAGRLMGRRLAAVGAGLGIVLQGLALLLLDLQFAVLVSR